MDSQQKISYNYSHRFTTKYHNFTTILPLNTTKNTCKFCNKIFSRNDSRTRHEKICKEKKNKIIEFTKIELLENKIKELENIITINNCTNNGTIINNINTINNIKITFGKEEIDKILKKDKKKILNSGYSSLIKLIEIMHLNKEYPQYQNIKIHNLKDKYAKTFDISTNNFTTVNKKDTIDSLICSRTLDLKLLHDTYHKKDNKFHQCVLNLIDKIETYTPDIDDIKILDFYKKLTEEIILLIYNKTKIFEI